jgi:hypothetical protein
MPTLQEKLASALESAQDAAQLAIEQARDERDLAGRHRDRLLDEQLREAQQIAWEVVRQLPSDVRNLALADPPF